MPGVRISNLPAATTPLAGTEELAVVQSGATKRTSVTDVVAGGLGFTPVDIAGDTMTGALEFATTDTLASAGTTNLGAATSNDVIVTGTTTITAFGTASAGALRVVTFSGALTLTHDGTSLILPGAVNITTAAGDVGVFKSLGSGNWRCASYSRASGLPIVNPPAPPPPSAQTGAVMCFAFNAAPTGWLEADGSQVSRTTYADLFAAIGVTFGVGDGVTTFTLPDLRAEFVRGWDDGRGVDAGRVFGTAQSELVGPHTHDVGITAATSPGGPSITEVSFSQTGTQATSNPAGAETRPRNVALLYCIKT